MPDVVKIHTPEKTLRLPASLVEVEYDGKRINTSDLFDGVTAGAATDGADDIWR
jgi:hypothetical protein